MKLSTFKRIIVRGCFMLFIISPFSCSELLLDHCGGLASALAAAETKLTNARVAEAKALGLTISAAAELTLRSAAEAAASAALTLCEKFQQPQQCQGFKDLLKAAEEATKRAADDVVRAKDEYDATQKATKAAQDARDAAKKAYDDCINGPHTQSVNLQVKNDLDFYMQKKDSLKELREALLASIRSLEQNKEEIDKRIVGLEDKKIDFSNQKLRASEIGSYIIRFKAINDETERDYREVTEIIAFLEKDLKTGK